MKIHILENIYHLTNNPNLSTLFAENRKNTGYDRDNLEMLLHMAAQVRQQRHWRFVFKQRFKSKKQKYRGMFETQMSGDKTSSGEIGINIRTPAGPKVGQDQVSGGVSVLCWHAAPVANVMPESWQRRRKSKSTLSEWIKSIADVPKRKTRRFKHSVNTRHEFIFCDPEVVREISRLHENFVIVSADKTKIHCILIHFFLSQNCLHILFKFFRSTVN